jgi:hypothetical protein
MGFARGQGVARKDYRKLEIVISNKKKNEKHSNKYNYLI